MNAMQISQLTAQPLKPWQLPVYTITTLFPRGVDSTYLLRKMKEQAKVSIFPSIWI